MKRRLWPIWLSVNTIAAAAASAPPEDTPTSAGSASGLRNSPCMMAPEAASRAPTIAAAAMRGIRIDHSTSWSRASVGRRVAPQPERGRQPRQRNAGRAHGQRDQRRADERDQQADKDKESGWPERVSAARLRTRRVVGEGGHSRQLAEAAAGVNFSACGASAG